MIWIQFSSVSDPSPSTTFAGVDVQVLIKVLTDPLVEGITLTGKVVCPDGSEVSLDFESGVAFFELKEDEREDGEYRAEVMVTKPGYHDTTLSAHFYYIYAEPSTAKLDWAI